MNKKPFHGMTVINCWKCGKLSPIDVRLPQEIEEKQWETLFQKIQNNKLECLECKKKKY